jgi:hypothetical protein
MSAFDDYCETTEVHATAVQQQSHPTDSQQTASGSEDTPDEGFASGGLEKGACVAICSGNHGVVS